MSAAPAPLNLPHPKNPSGESRLVGIEIEFGGLGEADAAEVVAKALGGEIRDSGPHERIVADTALGDIEVMLDTRFREKTDKLTQTVLDLLTGIVPVEIVTAPIRPEDIPKVDQLNAALRNAGAMGSRAGILLGFGMHLNPEVAGEGIADIRPVAAAYAFLEDMIRADDPIDASRRLLPFVDPYPREWLDALAADEAQDWAISDMIDAYLATTPSRNRGLDLLPLFRHLDEDRVVAKMGDDSEMVSARPAYHYRLPDCRIDEADWSIAAEWNRWVKIERIAADGDAIRDLAKAWRDYRDEFTATRSDWRQRSADIAKAAGW